MKEYSFSDLMSTPAEPPKSQPVAEFSFAELMGTPRASSGMDPRNVIEAGDPDLIARKTKAMKATGATEDEIYASLVREGVIDSPEAVRAKALRSGRSTIGVAPEESFAEKAWMHGANVGRGLVSGTGQMIEGVGNWLSEVDDFLWNKSTVSPLGRSTQKDLGLIGKNAVQRGGEAVQGQAVPMYGLQAAEPSILAQSEEALGAMVPGAALAAASGGTAAPYVGAAAFAMQGSGGTEDDPTWTAAETKAMHRVNTLLGATEAVPILRAWGRLTGPVKRELAASALKRFAIRAGRVGGAVAQGGLEETIQETGSQIVSEVQRIKTENPEMDTVDAVADATDKVMQSDAPKVAFFMGSVFGLLGAGNAAKIEFLDPPVKKWFGENPEKATAVMDRIRAKEALRRADVKGIPGFEKSTADQRASLADSLEMHELALSNSARMENLTGNRPGVETVMPEQSAGETVPMPQEGVVEPPTAPVVAETQAEGPVVPEQATEAVAGVSEQIGAAPGEPETTAPPKPSEPGVSPPLPEPVRLAFESVDTNRAKRGLPPVPKPESITDVKAWDDMLARNQADPTWLDTVQKKTTWTREETLGMLYRQMQLEQSRLASADALNQLKESKASPEDIAAAYQRYQDASTAANAFEEANRAAAFEWGGAGRYRQMFLADKDSKPYLESTLRASKGGESLSEADHKLIDDVVQKGEKERIAQGKRDIAIVEAEFDDAVKEAEKEAAPPKSHQTMGKRLKKFFDAVEKEGKAADDELMNILRGGQLFANPLDPKILSLVSKSMAGKMVRLGRDVATVTNAMIEKFGEAVRPYLDDAYANATKTLDDNIEKSTKGLHAKKAKESFKAKAKKETISPEEKAAAAVEQLKAREGESGPEIGSESRGLIQKLIRAAVEAGERGTEPVTNWVIERMKPLFPDITARKIKEIYSEYGKEKTPSNLPVNVELRRLRRLFQMQLKIADVEKGLKDLQEGKGEASERDKATGYRRDKADKEERALAKQLNELKKKFEKEATALGVKIPTRAGLLESILGRTKRHLRNQIEDLDEQIRTRTKKVGAKTDPVVDQEILDLRKTRDEKRKEFDAIFGKPEMSPEKRLELAMKAADKTIARLEKSIAEGDVRPKPKAETKTPQTPDLLAKKARVKELRQIKQDMLDLDNPYQNMLYRKGVEKSIAELKRRQEAGEFAPKPKRHIDLDKESITASADKESAREAFNKAKDRYEYQQMSKWEKVGYYADRAIEASKTLLVNAPLDFSSIGRQSRLATLAELPTVIRSIPDMLRSWKSREFFEKLRERIRYSPNHNEYRRAKLSLDFNEFFRSEWIRRIPGWGSSGRFFDANMMLLKVNIFDKFLARAEAVYGKGRVPDSELRQYSSDLQTMLGSTTSIKIGRWEGSTKGGFLQKAFLAPAWKLSQLLNSTGFPLIRGLVNLSRGKNPVASRMIVEQYARIYGGMAVFFGILAAAGFTVDDDPVSPTFGGVKRKGGDQWWMPFPAVTQEFGFLNRVVYGERKTSKGKTIVTRPEPERPLPFGQMSVKDEIQNKVGTMLAPIPSATFQFFTGENPAGQPVTRTEALAGAYFPITARETIAAAKRNPRKWLAEAIYAFTVQSLGESGRPTQYPKNQ